MINNKTKTFTGNVHIFSNDDSKLPLWNTNTNSFIDSVMTNNIIEVIAEDKNEARTKINKIAESLQSRVTLGHDKQATKYINQIFVK
jgi:superfamily I DNA and RNA helicase